MGANAAGVIDLGITLSPLASDSEVQPDLEALYSAIVAIQRYLTDNPHILLSYTTTEKTALTAVTGTLIFDTTLGKACIKTASGWQTITSV